ncbi:stimulator of interferon genes protein-like [Anneissia japonica]|uniref:stimulator of interferon genes protein-like n=1 Tax=Anneissia japonica TaxID=1529436 RepID=UPI0014257C6B|nr:stimulator of interferon genes protein-like [Anneissia japonica]
MMNWFKPKYQRVPSSENYDFGVIPKRRGNRKQWTAAFFIMIFVLHYYWTVSSMQPETSKTKLYGCLNRSDVNNEVAYNIHMYHYIFALVISFCCAIIGKAIQCFCVFTEEIRHIDSRHNNSYWLAFKSCFQVFFTKASSLGVGVMVFGVILMRITYEQLFDHHVAHFLYWPSFISSVGVAMITNYMFGFKTLSVVELSEIHESTNTNVAQGLAWSYFTGYLKIILPHLKDKINEDTRWKKELEDKNLPCIVFAIVPLNCKIPAKLGDDEVKHEGITYVSNLPKLEIDRAGIKKRVYFNSVYQIQNSKGHTIHAICEYVTVVDTLFQMPWSDAIDPKTREEQCRLLVRILEELIDNDSDCRNRCKIVVLSGEDRPLLRDVLYDKIQEPKMDISE